MEKSDNYIAKDKVEELDKSKPVDPVLENDDLLDPPGENNELANVFNKNLESLYKIDFKNLLKNKDMDPFQVFGLELIQANILKPIDANIKVLSLKKSSGSGDFIGESISDSLTLHLSKNLKLPVLLLSYGASKLSILEYDNLAQLFLDFEKNYSDSPLKYTNKANVYLGAVKFGAKIGKDIANTKETDINFSNVTSVLTLLQPIKYELNEILKRKPEEVASKRPKDPDRIKNIKLLVRVLGDLKKVPNLSENSLAVVNLLTKIIALSYDDKELGLLLAKARPLVQYLLNRPDVLASYKSQLFDKGVEDFSLTSIADLFLPKYVDKKKVPDNFKKNRLVLEEGLEALKNKGIIKPLYVWFVEMYLNRIEAMIADGKSKDEMLLVSKDLSKFASSNNVAFKFVVPFVDSLV